MTQLIIIYTHAPTCVSAHTHVRNETMMRIQAHVYELSKDTISLQNAQIQTDPWPRSNGFFATEKFLRDHAKISAWPRKNKTTLRETQKPPDTEMLHFDKIL